MEDIRYWTTSELKCSLNDSDFSSLFLVIFLNVAVECAILINMYYFKMIFSKKKNK